MIYQVRVTVFFDIEDEAQDFYHDCELALAKGTSINPSSPNAEFSTIERILSNHDLDPNQPSVILESESNRP